MRGSSKGFAPILIIAAIVVIGIIGYFGYKNISTNLWVQYKDPKGKFSFEYPKDWYYEPKGYTIPGTWIPVNAGLYSIPKATVESELKNLNKVKVYGLTFYNENISNFMPEDYEISSTKHDYFGKTDVVTNVYCLREGTLGKGNVKVKANTVCETHSLIVAGDSGVFEVSAMPTDNPTYQKILSTIKFTN